MPSRQARRLLGTNGSNITRDDLDPEPVDIVRHRRGASILAWRRTCRCVVPEIRALVAAHPATAHPVRVGDRLDIPETASFKPLAAPAGTA
ncbi:hypothetical protein NDN01_17005 [Sphingomonas sp. QA11]|uniref:hypothetical protein n=1 Tax=Sphingomonas sp. QA11 TaxID=2950605 RepID=UPI00234B91F7|nr:hypothetical protein [Sphingomonas sp. QA11]WCM25728.1 hypothetical protein NDN01_17005 [Sphingomonas sp. QA11]